MTDLLARLADALDPPAMADDIATPSAFAEAHSRGKWRRAPHLDVIEREVLRTIEEAGRLIVSVSVRHGKSEFLSRWLLAWYLGRYPDHRVILATHSANYSATHGRYVRDILIEHGHRFGVSVSRASAAKNDWNLSSPHTGGMFAVGVDGAVIGRGAHLAVIDDPVAKYEDAMSPLMREKAKEWFTGSLTSRLEPDAAVVLIMARWHEDDLAGFLLSTDTEEDPSKRWREIRLPAIADDPDDPMGRAIGEPLWPERYDLAELERRHRGTSLALGESVWLAQYQQRPTTPTGGMFPSDRWRTAPAVNIAWEPIRWCRGWDLAATEGGGDWTVGVLLGRRADGVTLVGDVVRGRWSSSEVRDQILATARADPPGTRIELPQDPGQAGKDQASQLAAMLSGFDVHAEPQTGSKEVRATGWAAQQQAENVVLLAGEWQGAFIVEHQGFPKATHDDQVDAAATAFNALVDPESRPTTTTPYSKGRALRGMR